MKRSSVKRTPFTGFCMVDMISLMAILNRVGLIMEPYDQC